MRVRVLLQPFSRIKMEVQCFAEEDKTDLEVQVKDGTTQMKYDFVMVID